MVLHATQEHRARCGHAGFDCGPGPRAAALLKIAAFPLLASGPSPPATSPPPRARPDQQHLVAGNGTFCPCPRTSPRWAGTSPGEMIGEPPAWFQARRFRHHPRDAFKGLIAQ